MESREINEIIQSNIFLTAKWPIILINQLHISIMLYKKERFYLIKKIEKLVGMGLLNIEGGGISIRVAPNRILVTPTGSAFRLWEVKPGDILVTDERGKIIERGKYFAVAEFPIALHIFNKFKICNSVFHTHGPFSLAYASIRRKIPKSTHHVEVLGEIPCLRSPNETKNKR